MFLLPVMLILYVFVITSLKGAVKADFQVHKICFVFKLAYGPHII